MTTCSLARKEGLEAVERRAADEALVERKDGLVIPVTAEAAEVIEDCELGPVPWPRWL